MATALKIGSNIPATKHWPMILAGVRPVYVPEFADKSNDYPEQMKTAIAQAVGPLPIRDSIELYCAMIEYQDGDRPYEEDSIEDEASFYTLGVACSFIANGTARSKSEARARAAFLAARVKDADGEIAAGLNLDLVATAIKNMEKDIQSSSRRSLQGGSDPEFNPLREIASRLRFLDSNYERLYQGGAEESFLSDEEEALYQQAACCEIFSPADALLMVGAVEYGVHPLINAIGCDLEGAEGEEATRLRWQMTMAKNVLRAAFRLANWLESTYAIDRRRVGGSDMLVSYLDPARKDERIAETA